MRLAIFLVAISLFVVACSEKNVDRDEYTYLNQTNETDATDIEPTPAAEADVAAMPPGVLEVNTETVAYFGDVEGFLAEPAAEGDYPGVILIHEWWGLNDNMRATAQSLASHGYRVLVVDLYNGEVATNQSDAQRLRTSVTAEAATENLAAANEFLRERGSEAVASWGFCFGGGQSATLATTDVPIDATVVYYGDLTAPLTNPEEVDAPMMLVFGTEDQSTTASSARNLALELEGQVPVQLEIYEGVGHAFANPSNARHDREKTRDAWEKTIAFLDENLR